MRLNLWWSGQRDERFWMEITDRPAADLGENLLIPQVNGVGREEWSYSLVAETQPGDVVLHWHKDLAGEPAIVGWSQVIGPLAVGQMTWQARGTRGRARGKATTGPSWIMPCGGLNSLSTPITKDTLVRVDSALRKMRDDLEAEVGKPYFPFMFYRPGEVRAAQAYLTKFPAALIGLIPDLGTQFPKLRPPATSGGRKTVRRSPGPGRLQDPVLRKAIERHAVDLAVRHYRDHGATSIKELGAPYDLLVMALNGERHVEVKGSVLAATAVELTVNEVSHAHHFASTDLVVVDEIGWSRDAAGTYQTTGGNLRIWEDWQPAETDLAATAYRYQLPG